MAKIGLRLKMNVSKIDKARLFKGEKGSHLDATVFVDIDELNQYGNSGVITQDVSAEERQGGMQGHIIGDCKVFWKGEGQQQSQQPQRQQPQQQGGYSQHQQSPAHAQQQPQQPQQQQQQQPQQGGYGQPQQRPAPQRQQRPQPQPQGNMHPNQADADGWDEDIPF